MTQRLDLYNNVYGNFGSSAEADVRRLTFGEDIGQTSWITATSWLRYADRAGVTATSRVLEVGSGSGGPAIYLAERRGCGVTGVDINAHGIENGRRLAVERGVADRVEFQTVDASRALPFPDNSFDAILSNDAMCHIANRLDVLRDWYRLLRPGGRMLFSDALVMTGPVSNDELATRSAIGLYIFVPPGENERLIAAAGFISIETTDETDDAATIAQRWHDARARHESELVAREGDANFAGLQRFLSCVHVVSAERRLSRLVYVAAKPA